MARERGIKDYHQALEHPQELVGSSTAFVCLFVMHIMNILKFVF